MMKEIMLYHGFALFGLAQLGEGQFDEGFSAVYTAELAIHYRENLPLPQGKSIAELLDTTTGAYRQARDEVYEALTGELPRAMYSAYYADPAKERAGKAKQEMFTMARKRMAELAVAEMA